MRTDYFGIILAILPALIVGAMFMAGVHHFTEAMAAHAAIQH